ncbi:MAG: ACP S-malonyltransferase [Bacillota bacterium]|nr:ACP S-malonyltransferase [Bacillota bacterium]
MPNLAFIFPGQGAQYTGMGKELSLHFDQAAAIFHQADEISSYSISKLCFDNPEGKLNQTEFAQPALLINSLAACEVALLHGLKPSMVSGLSLGEYSALVTAGSLTLEEALPLIQTRARYMQNAVPIGRGAMAAVLGPDIEAVEATCEEDEGIVSIANYNCPGQVVISGEGSAVERVGKILKSKGYRVIPLAVSVPSHSMLMFDAAMAFKGDLGKIQWKESNTPVISNVNACENASAQLVDILSSQLYKPVRWEDSVRYMMQHVDYFIEIGPGSTLSGLIKKIDKSRILGNIEDMRSLEKTLKKVNEL